MVVMIWEFSIPSFMIRALTDWSIEDCCPGAAATAATRPTASKGARILRCIVKTPSR